MAPITTAHLSLTRRPRRLRRTEAVRSLVRETRLTPDCFIYPLFVCEGEGVRREIPSMPGICQLSVDEAVTEAAAAKAEGIPAVLLFGLPDEKDPTGSAAADPDAPVQTAIRALKRAVSGLLVVTDVCLCEYTSHGHCGIVDGDEILNDATVMQLAQAALSHAVAGADVVAPSDMMDGRVAAIRRTLDDRGFDQTAIMSYAAKYCSGFYGPFREAADSTPQFGDRRSHQMDPANVEEALREGRSTSPKAGHRDGKPALPPGRSRGQGGSVTRRPRAGGRQSAMLKAARRGWLDEPRVMLGDADRHPTRWRDMIIMDYAREAARLLNEETPPVPEALCPGEPSAPGRCGQPCPRVPGRRRLAALHPPRIGRHD
jgi:porphobilinogen synthase